VQVCTRLAVPWRTDMRPVARQDMLRGARRDGAAMIVPTLSAFDASVPEVTRLSSLHVANGQQLLVVSFCG
jgi:hypothetical protein